jgi:hypothetical protein
LVGAPGVVEPHRPGAQVQVAAKKGYGDGAEAPVGHDDGRESPESHGAYETVGGMSDSSGYRFGAFDEVGGPYTERGWAYVLGRESPDPLGGGAYRRAPSERPPGG